jgi:hypothetical protein
MTVFAKRHHCRWRRRVARSGHPRCGHALRSSAGNPVRNASKSETTGARKAAPRSKELASAAGQVGLAGVALRPTPNCVDLTIDAAPVQGSGGVIEKTRQEKTFVMPS